MNNRGKRRIFFLGEEKPQTMPGVFLMRKKIVVKYHALLQRYSEKLAIYEKIFEALAVAREDKEFLTRGELVAILHRKLSMTVPNQLELDHLHDEMYRFRKWLGTIAGLLVYVKHEHITDVAEDFDGKEWIYRPIKDKKEYEKIHAHLKNEKTAIVARMTENEDLLAMTEKQITKIIEDIREQLELKAKGYDVNVGRKKKQRK